MAAEPTTLQEAIIYFADPVNCREYLVARRWPKGVTCPRCGGTDVLFLEKYNRWHCRAKHAAPQFTLKTGTIMEDSPIGLDKWLAAMWQVVNCKNGISSYEIHRALGITQKTAWFLDHRIRLSWWDPTGLAQTLLRSARVDNGNYQQTIGPDRSGRNFHRWKSTEHARLEARKESLQHWRKR